MVVRFPRARADGPPVRIQNIILGDGRFEEAPPASHGHRSLAEPFAAMSMCCGATTADLVTECEPKPRSPVQQTETGAGDHQKKTEGLGRGRPACACDDAVVNIGAGPSSRLACWSIWIKRTCSPFTPCGQILKFDYTRTYIYNYVYIYI